jgi:hypothetical protein
MAKWLVVRAYADESENLEEPLDYLVVGLTPGLCRKVLGRVAAVQATRAADGAAVECVYSDGEEAEFWHHFAPGGQRYDEDGYEQDDLADEMFSGREEYVVLDDKPDVWCNGDEENMACGDYLHVNVHGIYWVACVGHELVESARVPASVFREALGLPPEGPKGWPVHAKLALAVLQNPEDVGAWGVFLDACTEYRGY